MKQQTFMFTIPGNPQSIIRYKNHSHSVRDRYQDARSFYRVSLANQHTSETVLAGPVAVDCTFFFDAQEAKQLSPRKTNYHKQFPTLPLLYGFIEHIMKGFIFNNEVLVARISMTKLYDINPRTDIIITKL